MIDAFGGVRAQSVLDVGCGTGGNLPFLKRYGAKVIGLDSSEEAIALAREKVPGGDIRKGDINDLGRLYAANRSILSPTSTCCTMPGSGRICSRCAIFTDCCGLAECSSQLNPLSTSFGARTIALITARAGTR